MPRWRGSSTWRDNYDPRHADRRYRDRWSVYDGTRGNFYSGADRNGFSRGQAYGGPDTLRNENGWNDSTGMGRGFDWRQ